MPKARQLVYLALLACTFFLSACQTTQQQAENKSFLAPDKDETAIRIAVTGQIPQPGYYTVSPQANIATVLVQSGWTPYFAKEKYENSPTIFIKRLSEGHQDSWIFQMDELYDDEWMNFQLKDGDIINVMIILF